MTVTVIIRKDIRHGMVKRVKAASAVAAWRAAGVLLAVAKSRVHIASAAERATEGKYAAPSVSDSLSIQGREGDTGLLVGSFGAHGGRPVALWLENGTVKTHAAPYLRPAAILARKTLKQEAAAEINRLSHG